jgi:hypothetical protein
MTPPRSSRSSRFAEEAVVSFGRPRVHELVADRDERMWLDIEAKEGAEARLAEVERTDAGMVVEIVGGGWRARWVLASQGGLQVVRSVMLEPEGAVTPPGGVTTNLLRELSPQRALASIAHNIPSRAVEMFSGPDFPVSDGKGGKGGRPRVRDEELARVATAYLAQLQSGHSGITTRIRQELGYKKDSAVRDRVRMCRERGWLSPTQQGRRGGGPGPALIAYQDRVKGEAR